MVSNTESLIKPSGSEDPYWDLRAPVDNPELDTFTKEAIARGFETEKLAYADQIDRINFGRFAHRDDIPYPSFLKDKLLEEDLEFKTKFPDEYQRIEAIFGTVENRWQRAEELRNTIIDTLGDSVDPRYTIVCSAKSNLRIFEKARRYGIPYTQIYDPFRVRVVTGYHSESANPFEAQQSHAENIVNTIERSRKFPYMNAVVFSPLNSVEQGEDVHNPRRDTIRGGSNRGLFRARLNVHFNGGVGEIQIWTAKSFDELGQKGRILHKGAAAH